MFAATNHLFLLKLNSTGAKPLGYFQNKAASKKKRQLKKNYPERPKNSDPNLRDDYCEQRFGNSSGNGSMRKSCSHEELKSNSQAPSERAETIQL